MREDQRGRDSVIERDRRYAGGQPIDSIDKIQHVDKGE